MTDADPITLPEAAARFGLTVATLRAEHARGNLALYKIGKRLYTSPAAIRDMFALCRVEPKAPASIAIRRAANTASETAEHSFVSAQQALMKLKSTSRNTSQTSTSRSPMERR